MYASNFPYIKFWEPQRFIDKMQNVENVKRILKTLYVY